VINRPELLDAISYALRHNPVVALLGPRQCGKTTLARLIARRRLSWYFDLEDPADLASLATAPQQALQDLSGLVIIDEVQRKPDLFELLRVLSDRPGRRAAFLLLGSASPYLVRGVSETLAGRVAFVEMGGFDAREIGDKRLQRLWMRGGFPKSFLAPSDQQSLAWRNDFIKTFLERDVPQLGFHIPTATLRRFWTMLAHYHGQIWNAAEFARSLGSSESTARRYLDLLSGAYVVRVLPPWFENVSKRQVKAPKVYVRDTGLLHALLALRGIRSLRGHPKYGASWEGFALEQVLSLFKPREGYFWATHAGAELDLLIFQDGKRLGFEMKCEDAPRLTKSMRIAMETLALDRLCVVYPGSKRYILDRGIEALPLISLEE
jgi:predicted AAA+ superfamily ATPase